MKSNVQVAKDFSLGITDSESNNMFIRGDTVFSYGTHFPIAKRATPEVKEATGKDYIFNSNGYSNTTAKHKSEVACAINYKYIEVPNCDLSEVGLKKFLKEIKENEIDPYIDRLNKLKTMGKRAQGYKKAIDAANEKYKTYENILHNIYGGTAVLYIKALSKEFGNKQY